MYVKSNSQNIQENIINECPESFVDLSPSEPAPTQSWISNPFDQLYQIEDWVYDNATVEIKEILSDLHYEHYDAYYSVDHLEQLVCQIKHHQLSYVRDAISYYQILTKRLYKAKYSNMNQFAQAELGMTSWRCKQIIEAGAVTLKLIAAGHTKLPLNSTQAYALSKLDDEKLVEVWESVLEMYELHEITAEKITLVAFPPEPTKVLKGTNITVMPSTYEQLVVNACKLKITINDYITYLLELQKCKYSLLLAMVNFKT